MSIRKVNKRRDSLTNRVIAPTLTDPAFDPLRDHGSSLVPGTGNLLAKVAIVGEAPGETEDTEKVPFVGPAGILLDEFIGLAGLRRGDCYITNVIKYWPVTATGAPRNPTFPERKSGARYLARELAIIRPKLVVLCGRVAFQAVTSAGDSIVRERGKPFHNARWPDRRYYPVLHPAACLRGPDEWMMHTRADWIRIAQQGWAR